MMNIMLIERVNGAIGDVGVADNINNEPNKIKLPKIMFAWLSFIIILFFIILLKLIFFMTYITLHIK